MSGKVLTIAFYRREWSRDDWEYRFPDQELDEFLAAVAEEMGPFGVTVQVQQLDDMSIDINGYGDVLNSVRLRYPAGGHGNLCLGHVIGSSPNADLVEDLRRGVNRVVFAPETIEPEGSDKVVCHNCGCGC